MTETIEPLFQPLQLLSVTLRSRIVMAPMTRCFSPGGVPGQNVADYYRRRAEAGVGLIVTEGTGIDHPSAIGSGAHGESNIPVLHGEAALAGWRKVVDDVHAAGGLIFPQLWHMGVLRTPGTGPFPEAPSSRPSGIWGPQGGSRSMNPEYVERMLAPTEPMTESEIADVIAGYARSAASAKSVGFDGIAIHAAHGYLIDTFFWDQTNRRTDRWGGDPAGRARFGAEVVKAIRGEVGPDVPIMLRYSQWKQQDYDARIARTPRELEELLRPLVDAGVDVFDASTRIFSQPAFEGSDLTLAGWTKQITGKPSMAVGGVGLSRDLLTSLAAGAVPENNLAQVLTRFERGEFDLLAVGRSLLVDPEWALKARRGEPFKPFSLEQLRQLY
ncbi:NADH:flavin oxidoreductase [Sorangium sp. So ce1078]|uniref:NADH:flavin oxidoreductase n=1 Tax=Sorangium sp. So ce1078 TaxID=3133329 RepID=UPI003F600DB9